MIKNSGTVELMKNIIYYVQGKGNSHDFLFLTGDAQPVSSKVEYLLGEEIIKVAKSFGVATEEDGIKLLNSLDVLKIDNGSISGMNGILLGIAKINNLNGISLLGETSGYVVDANASKHLLKKLLAVVGLEVNMEDLDRKAKDTIMLIKSIEQRMV